MTASAFGSVMECSNAPGQPTIAAPKAKLTAVAVSCSKANSVIVTANASGDLSSNPFIVTSPMSGPPATGTDSAGNSATTDAALYPCPPTTAQQNAGATCFMEYDQTGDGGSVTSSPITFTGQNTVTTTTMGAVACTPAPTTSAGPPSMTANPGTCLNGGSVVDAERFGL